MSSQYVIKKGSEVNIVTLTWDECSEKKIVLTDTLFLQESSLRETYKDDDGIHYYVFTLKFRGVSDFLGVPQIPCLRQSMYVVGEFVQIKSVQNTPEKRSSESTDFKGSGYSRMGVQRGNV